MVFLVLIGGGIIIGLIAAAPIGPVNLICLRRSFAYGAVNGFFSGLGAALGDTVFAIVTGFGLTAITQLIEGYSTLLRFAGGLMLLGFGLHIFRSDVTALGDSERSAREDGVTSLPRTIASTFALTMTNPATLFGFTALFAVLSSLVGGTMTFFDTAIVVAGVFAGSALWWFALATIVGIFHRRIDDSVMRGINRFFGVAVTGLGVFVLANLAFKFI